MSKNAPKAPVHVLPGILVRHSDPVVRALIDPKFGITPFENALECVHRPHS